VGCSFGNPQISHNDRESRSKQRSEGAMIVIVGEGQWTKAQIAALSDSQLAHMNYDEMVELVLVAGVPVHNVERIHTMEGDTLMRLVNWARVCCRRETA
jgi:hypothetical protein